MTLVLLLISLNHPASGSDAVSPSHICELSESASNWSPELTAAQWGWRLTKYKGLGFSYQINGQAIILLSTGLDLLDNVLWNPLSGMGRHLNFSQQAQFRSVHQNQVVQSWLRSLPLYGGRTLETIISPGQTFSCHSVFDHYYNVVDDDHKLIRSFYVVSKLPSPEITNYHICSEAAGPEKRIIRIFYDTAPVFPTGLSDGSLIFSSIGSGDLILVRLDGNMIQRSTVGQRIFILDADAINKKLYTGITNDPIFRYNIFRQAIDQIIKSNI